MGDGFCGRLRDIHNAFVEFQNWIVSMRVNVLQLLSNRVGHCSRDRAAPGVSNLSLIKIRYGKNNISETIQLVDAARSSFNKARVFCSSIE